MAIIPTKICDCGNDTWEKDFDGSKPVWVCVNCRDRKPRRVYTRKSTAPRKGSKRYYQILALDLIERVHANLPWYDRFHWDFFLNLTSDEMKKTSLFSFKYHYSELIKTLEKYEKA